MKKSLVSILIPNYNYDRYLRECLDSVLAQTYDNFEVIISDNRSTDNSYDTISCYKKKFEERGIWCDVLQNKRNIGSAGNTAVCYSRSEGEYFIWLSSDDSLEPDAIEKMTKALDMYPHAGFVMAHRNEMDDSGIKKETAPFYNQSCFVPGEEQAAVFMMAGIAVSSQILFRKITYQNMLKWKQLRFQVAGDWYDNFLMACVGDVIYVKKALVNYRIHGGNETSDSEANLMGIFEHYSLINAFRGLADSFGMSKPQKRYNDAVKKLGYMCLRYARKMILNQQYRVADKYLKLATILYDEMEGDARYIELAECLGAPDPAEAVKNLVVDGTYVRQISYDPPENSIRIEALE